MLDTIEVKGLARGDTKDYVRLFFESRKSGGGDIKEITLKDGKAVITFKDHQGMCMT